MKLQTNVGRVDAVIRYLVGIALLLIVVLGHGPWRWLGLLGLIPILTASVNFCPIWRLFGIDTRHQRGHGTQPRPH